MNRLGFLLVLFSQFAFIDAIFGETILFEYEGMTYNIVSRTDFTAELYDASTFKEIKLPESASYNGRDLTVIGISYNALNNSIKANKEINLWLTPSCSYIKTQSEKGGTINIYMSSLDDYLRMTESINYKKNLYYANGDPIESNIEIPEVIKSISCKYAFSNVSSVHSINIERDGLKLPYGFCSNCKNLQSATLSPCTLENEVFKGCSSLEIVNITGSGEYKTGSDTFRSCSKLEKINGMLIGNIPIGCFNYCSSLKELSFGTGNHKIHSSRTYSQYSTPNYEYDGAFKECSNLSRLNFPDAETICRISYGSIYDSDNYYSPAGDYSIIYSFFKTNNIFRSCGFGRYYINNEEVKSFRVPDDIETLNEGAFCNTRLNSFDLNRVKHLKSYSIYNCGLDYLFIPSTVETIESNSVDCIEASFEHFKYASTSNPINGDNLEYLTIYDCNSLRGFSGCSKLHTVNIDYLGGNIESSAFDGCSNLSNFICKRSASGLSINSYAFRNSGITDFKIPEGITSIKELAFEGSAIKSLELCNVQRISLVGSYKNSNYVISNSGSFANCSNLKTLIVNGYASIPSYYGYSMYPWVDSNIENIVFGDNRYIADVDFYVTGRGRGGTNYTYIGVESNLKSVKLGRNVEELYLFGIKSISYNNSSWSFIYDKTQIDYVEVKNPNPPVVYGGFSDWTFMNATLHVPEEALDRYKSDSYWGQFWNIQGEKFEYESGIQDIINDKASTNIYCNRINQSEIQLVNAEKCNVKIYDMSGVNVYFTHSYEGEAIRLPKKGLYIIKCENNTVKVIL